MNHKNIKIKLLLWHTLIITIVLSIFSLIILNEFNTFISEKEVHIKSSLNHLTNLLIIWIPILLIISSSVGYFIIRKALSPVKTIIDEVKEIEASKLEKRITVIDSNDVIDELIITFNFMLDKLDESFSKIKRFSNDVSHELKTPLTVIRGEIELGLRKDRTNDEYKNILYSTLEETKQLQELVDGLLFLSKANNDEIKDKFETVELDEIVTDVITNNKKLIEEKNIQFDIKKLDSVYCQGHPLLLSIIIGNIIQNAIKYSHKDSIVEVYLDENSLKIKDYGIGIKKDAIKNIFDTFYRVDKSRDRGGFGLGLSIVKSIGILHDFHISVDSKYNKYTQFSINFK